MNFLTYNNGESLFKIFVMMQWMNYIKVQQVYIPFLSVFHLVNYNGKTECWAL